MPQSNLTNEDYLHLFENEAPPQFDSKTIKVPFIFNVPAAIASASKWIPFRASNKTSQTLVQEDLNFRKLINDQGICRQIRRHILTDQNLKMTCHELFSKYASNSAKF